MKRLPNWPALLEALVSSRMLAPFAWGSNDCCLWAADAVHAITGTDPAADLRGTYATDREAVRLLAELGGLPIVAGRAGAELPQPLLAQAGDVGLVTDGERPLLGVCSAGVWLVPTRHGLGAIEFSRATRAWGVAHG